MQAKYQAGKTVQSSGVEVEFGCGVYSKPHAAARQSRISGIAVVYNQAKAMMFRANVPEKSKAKLFREVCKTAALLDGLQVINVENKEMTRFQYEWGENPRFVNFLKTWGAAGTVKVKTPTSPKINNKGRVCMMIRYVMNHTGNTYRMWDLETNGVHTTRDIIWLLKKLYEASPHAFDANDAY
mmetsp:Transcript_21337/g.30685  ORF Transcript_21337/g.30685 Transcript_21337/m.30685 type:complete len:183 (+) Transcript_21337:248-796(+)